MLTSSVNAPAATAYLATVAQRTVINRIEYYDAAKREVARERPIDAGSGSTASGLIQALASASTSPASRVANDELIRVVDECVADLEARHREVILLRDYAGAEWSFIAEQLDSPSEEAARQLHRRARAKLTSAASARR